MKNAKCAEWAAEYLVSHKTDEIIKTEKIIETSYSVVYKIHTTSGDFYLKQTPEALFLEPKTCDYLNQESCQHIPTVIAENKNLNSFLMTSCGDVTLRHLFNKKIDLHMMNNGIINYTNIQRTLETKLPQLSELGIPNWRLDRFAELYQNLIQQEELLISDGLLENELHQLHDAYKICIQLCEILSTYQLPETINHCDFHENNMLLNKKTGTISIIDWGETAIAHPFFSLNGCLWNITYFYKIQPTDHIYKKLQKQCITPWLDLYDEDHLSKAFAIANQLLGIFAALSYERMYNATMTQNYTLQQEHPGSIAGCLRTFLEAVK